MNRRFSYGSWRHHCIPLEVASCTGSVSWNTHTMFKSAFNQNCCRCSDANLISDIGAKCDYAQKTAFTLNNPLKIVRFWIRDRSENCDVYTNMHNCIHTHKCIYIDIPALTKHSSHRFPGLIASFTFIWLIAWWLHVLFQLIVVKYVTNTSNKDKIVLLTVSY